MMTRRLKLRQSRLRNKAEHIGDECPERKLAGGDILSYRANSVATQRA